jgi:hypothetical protein
MHELVILKLPVVGAVLILETEAPLLLAVIFSSIQIQKIRIPIHLVTITVTMVYIGDIMLIIVVLSILIIIGKWLIQINQ